MENFEWGGLKELLFEIVDQKIGGHIGPLPRSFFSQSQQIKILR